MAKDRPNNQHIYPIPTKYTRELIITLGTESATQKQRTSLELVRDINTIINSSGDMITTRYLLNKDIFMIFQEIPEKQK